MAVPSAAPLLPFLSANTRQWSAQTLGRFEQKLKLVRERNCDKLPASAVLGVYDDKSDRQDYPPCDGIYWWTNGFWPGLLWQAYHHTQEPRYRQVAQHLEEKLDACFLGFSGLHHDVGFMYLLSAVADYRLTGASTSRTRGLHAATLLAGRFNQNGFIRAWDKVRGQEVTGLVIIDSMLNIPLLYWASEETGDPRFAQIANRHADTVARHFIRPDGSVCHMMDFDPHTGVFLREPGGQGMGPGSSWSRGQGWALYGFTIAYRHTGDIRFLAIAEKIATYLVAQLKKTDQVPSDFRQPADSPLCDDSAAALIACGMLELARFSSSGQTVLLRSAVIILRRLVETCDWDEQKDGFLRNCTTSYHDAHPNVNLIYGDYYFYEALLKLQDQEYFLW